MACNPDCMLPCCNKAPAFAKTWTCASLEVNPATFHDIQRRLERAGVADEYIKDGMIIFGPVALHI